jgi:hypothetical protein
LPKTETGRLYVPGDLHRARDSYEKHVAACVKMGVPRDKALEIVRRAAKAAHRKWDAR